MLPPVVTLPDSSLEALESSALAAAEESAALEEPAVLEEPLLPQPDRPITTRQKVAMVAAVILLIILFFILFKLLFQSLAPAPGQLCCFLSGTVSSYRTGEF